MCARGVCDVRVVCVMCVWCVCVCVVCDDEHMCSKHVEASNKLIIKFTASSWLILINKYIEMHGQQNIKIRH